MIEAKLLQGWTRAWHGIERDDVDAASLALIMNGLNAAVEKAAQRLAFEDEPSAWQGAMDKLADGR